MHTITLEKGLENFLNALSGKNRSRFPVVIAKFWALRNYTLFYNGLRGAPKNDP